MISICTCSINAKFETQLFIDALYAHNPDTDFEICLTHDNRVDDGSDEYFAKLQEKYKTLKIITSTKNDAIEYIEKILAHYDKHNIFPVLFRNFLKSNLDKYRKDTLFDPTKSFLWLPSGWLYNKAVRASKGNTLIISPADYIYLFKLKELENYIQGSSKNGIFYSKFNGLLRTLSNSPMIKVNEFLERYKGQGPAKVGAGGSILRNYTCFPSTLDDCCIPDQMSGEIIKLTDPNFFTKTRNLCNRDSELRSIVHGLHCMTNQTYGAIGGFSEEFYGRAHSDDKMTCHGQKIGSGNIQLPKQFSFLWTPRSVFIPPRDPIQADPWQYKHPLQFNNCQCYLDHGLKAFLDKHGPNAAGAGNVIQNRVDAMNIFKRHHPIVRII